MERNPYLTEREQRELAEMEQLLASAERMNARDGVPRASGSDHARSEPDGIRRTH